MAAAPDCSSKVTQMSTSRVRSRRNVLAGALTGAVLSLAAGSAIAADAPDSHATVSVDFASSRGPLFRMERFNNLANATAFAAQRPADVAFFNRMGLHGQIYRVWLRDTVYDPKTGAYDYSDLLPYLTDASRISDSLLLNIQILGLIKKEHATPAQIKPVIKHIIRDLKTRFPKLTYIEATNEPDYNFRQEIKPEDLYSYYVPFYEAVNEVNAELRPKIPLKVGGPALTMLRLPYVEAFLDGYKADPSPKKRLDFFSYHAYGEFEFGSLTKAHFYKGDPSEVAGQRQALEAELRKRGLDPTIPSFIDELGLYPGPSFDDPKDPRPDYLRQAAGVPSLVYWFMESPHNVPFNWVLRHFKEERKDELVTRAGPGRPIPTGQFTPYGNALLMFSKMKTTRVAARSDALKQGKGVYAIAAKDATGASVMVWNYQHTGSTSFRTTIDLASLPPSLRGKPVRERVFRIDEKTSNYFADPQRANLQQVAERTLKPGARRSETVELGPNALELILLEPAQAARR